MTDFLWFGLKQAWASLFGALLLAAILVTKFWYPDIPLARYDFLFLYAVAIQIALVAFRLESLRECGVVILFHILATAMEVFKTSDAVGSWSYPGNAMFRIGNVPLFAGFMYSAVGSYIARIWRQFDMRFEKFPPVLLVSALAVLSYVNFFTHHYIWDIRWLLVVAIFFAYRKTEVIFRPHRRDLWMPLVLGFVLVAFFIWIAENISTFATIWIYPNQQKGWDMVGLSKLTAWFLLMQLSFVLIYVLRQFEHNSAGRKRR
jgi:uncharacterized membrane protein YoaT (DUF817 family)